MTKKSYHFIGIGGIGMSALAQILLEKEHPVSGSDLSLGKTVEELRKKGARILSHQAKENILPSTAVVYSSAIQENHPEIQEAKKLSCPLLHRSELLAQLTAFSRTIAVAGTHGKTTTTSLLTSLLLHAEREISFAVGGILKEYGVNGRAGQDELFVIEADESDNSFLRYTPAGAIITNVEEEHMECFGTVARLHDAFAQFFKQVKEERLLLYCGDDPHLRSLAAGRGRSYGFSEQSDICIRSYRQEEWHLILDLDIEGRSFRDIKVALTGRHNGLNAAAVFAMALGLGISEETIRKGLVSFQGVGRRTEKKFENEQILLLDDYAHHPTEVRSTLRAIREVIGPRRLVVLFQPHRYTRTRDQLEGFAKAFEDADLLYVTEIYAASEKAIEGVTRDTLIEKIKKGSHVRVEALSLEEGLVTLEKELVSQDVVVTMGAGSISSFGDRLADHLKTKGVRKLRVGVVFGGRSVEHEVSRKSAANVISALDTQLYDLSYFAIDKEGHWQMGESAQEMLRSEEEISFAVNDLFFSDQMRNEVREIDLFFPVIHGPNGEDGTLQGLFEMLQKPYVGPNHRVAAVGMDKVMTKRLLEFASIPTPPYVTFDRSSWRKDREEYLLKIEKELRYPLYVKPLHLGSSVGVTKVEEKGTLIVAIENAFLVDYALLVEQGIENARELEFAVVGNGAACAVPPPGEKLAGGRFVDYQMKYSKSPVPTAVVATLDPLLVEKGRDLALRAYRVLGGSGMMRVDFLLDQEGTFWCFEVNPIPGMMKYSLFPKMWEAAGLPPKMLFNRLIALGLARGRQCTK